MTGDEELGERGRAIFDRLRAEVGTDASPANPQSGMPSPSPPRGTVTLPEQPVNPPDDLTVDRVGDPEVNAVPPGDSAPPTAARAPAILEADSEPSSEPHMLHVEQENNQVPFSPPAWPATAVPDVVAQDVEAPHHGPPSAPQEVLEEPAKPARPLRPPPPDLPRIMAIANQKGGVGKTTTAVNLGAALAELGYRVLVVDLDPQGNATTGLGINPRNLEMSIYEVLLRDAPLDDCIEPTSVRNLFVCPATIDLAGAEIELVPAFSRELKLRRAIEQVIDDFDFFLIDCPPSLGLITVNGLAAATEVVVPIQCEYYALEGLGQLLRNVGLVQTNLNPRLEMTTIILTMYDARTKLSDQVASEVRTHFGTKVCRNIVPRTVRLSEAPSFGQPIVVFDPTSRGAIAYRELAKEVSGGAPQRVR